jgi:hypothetical protein
MGIQKFIDICYEFVREWDADPDTYDNDDQHRATPMEDPR